MIKIENTEIVGFEPAIRGMRNPMNSHSKSDSGYFIELPFEATAKFIVGDNDHNLMMKLAAGGSVHAKYRRMIVVYCDITAPLYWWKEADTYKVGTVRNSCSTMHKIHSKEFTFDDFSTEHLDYEGLAVFGRIIEYLNQERQCFLTTKDKEYWWHMIQMLPSNYNQRSTMMFNYEVLSGIYPMRKDHKLDEWHTFCDWIKSLPYSELITGE